MRDGGASAAPADVGSSGPVPEHVGDALPEQALHADDDAIAALLAATSEVSPLERRGVKRRCQAEHGGEDEEVTHPPIATRVQAVYEKYGDTARSKPLARRPKHSRAGKFNTRRLRLFESFVFKTGACGMSSTNVSDLWELFFEWESDTPPPDGKPKRLRDYFDSPYALCQALSDDIDEAVDNDGWYSCQLTELNETSEGFFRSTLSVIKDVLSCGHKVRYWRKGVEDQGPSECRETPFDGDAFRLCEEQVLRDCGPKSFVLALHA